MEFLSALRAIATHVDAKAQRKVEKAVDSQEVRDWGNDFAAPEDEGKSDESLARLFASATSACLRQDMPSCEGSSYDAEYALDAAKTHLKLIAMPECSNDAAKYLLSSEIARAVAVACAECGAALDDSQEEEQVFGSLVHACYARCPSERPALRMLIGNSIRSAMEDPTQMRVEALTVRMCLRVAASAFEGMQSCASQTFVSFARAFAAPSTARQAVSSISDAESVHEPMVQCIDRILAVDPPRRPLAPGTSSTRLSQDGQHPKGVPPQRARNYISSHERASYSVERAG